MQRFAFFLFLLLLAIGCSEQPSTPTASPAEVQQSGPVASPEEHAADAPELSSVTTGDIVLTPRTVMDGKLSLLIPESFSEMDEETLALKYPSDRRPTLVYTNASGSVNVAINHTKNPMPQGEIDAFHQQMDRMFRNLYPSAAWFESGIIEINGRKWLTLNLRTPAIDTEIRNILVGTSLDGRLLLVTFNVTKELEEDWLEAGEAMIQSIRIRD